MKEDQLNDAMCPRFFNAVTPDKPLLWQVLWLLATINYTVHLNICVRKSRFKRCLSSVMGNLLNNCILKGKAKF